MVESWLFIGNPGVGKSTLLNCLAKRVAFESGVSYGGGLTKSTQTCVDHKRGIVYTDTPGLADGVDERKAADAITHALRSCGPRIKLCFVLQLQFGRVMGQDLVTIERVLDSIHVADEPFGIIVNCASAALCKKLSSDATEFRRVVALVNSGKYATPYVLVVPEYPALVDKNNAIINLPSAMRTSLAQQPTAWIPHNAVSTIEVAGFQSSANARQQVVLRLETDARAMAKAQDDLARAKPDFWKISLRAMLVLAKLAILLVILL